MIIVKMYISYSNFGIPPIVIAVYIIDGDDESLDCKS